jgi:hypothetical protein
VVVDGDDLREVSHGASLDLTGRQTSECQPVPLGAVQSV